MHFLYIHLLVEVFQLQIVYFPKTHAQIAVRIYLADCDCEAFYASEAWVYACALAVTNPTIIHSSVCVYDT